MEFLELTSHSPAENLAIDEALLEEAERGRRGVDVLRLWELALPAVVIGRSSRVADEVHADACKVSGVPILRRTSGGAAIVAGPGCLMYSLILGYERWPALRSIEECHRTVLGMIGSALRSRCGKVARQGTSDLAVSGRKVSGNSLRCRRGHILYHGTLLYEFPLDCIAQYLKPPPRQPAYRAQRAHGEFVANLDIPRGELRQALVAAWQADQPSDPPATDLVAHFVKEKYACDEWNYRM